MVNDVAGNLIMSKRVDIFVVGFGLSYAQSCTSMSVGTSKLMLWPMIVAILKLMLWPLVKCTIVVLQS